MVEELKTCTCGGRATLYKWSASPTIFVKCDKCGKRTGDSTLEKLEWAVKRAIREWNRLSG